MSWAHRDESVVSDLMGYESELNRIMSNFPQVNLCLYDLTRCSGDLIMDVLKTHPKALLGGMVIDNPYYLDPDEFLASRPGLVTAEPGVAAPPAAARIPAERTHHGDTVIDEYAWLAGKENPATIAFLEAENAYTQALTAGQAPLRDAIFAEIRARTQETDLSVPARKGGWWYYSRTVEGKQYALHCRRAVRPSDTGPPLRPVTAGRWTARRSCSTGTSWPAAGQFFSLGAFSVSPDGRLLAYSTDFAGSERFTMRVKDLVTGETAADEIPGTFYGAAWSADGSALFYVTVDEAWRPYRVWRHVIGTPAADDVVVFEEADERFWVGVGLTRSERFLVISRLQQADQRGVAAGRRRPGRGVHGRGTAAPGRRVRGRAPGERGRHRPAADPAQRSRGELRAGLGRHWPTRRPGRRWCPTAPTPGCSGWTRSLTTSSSTCARTG